MTAQIIKLTKNEHQLFDNEKCAECYEKFILNNYLVHHGLFCYHLTCFKTYLENKNKEWKAFIEDNINMMNELKPYEKEMICETLLKEKYG